MSHPPLPWVRVTAKVGGRYIFRFMEGMYRICRHAVLMLAEPAHSLFRCVLFCINITITLHYHLKK